MFKFKRGLFLKKRSSSNLHSKIKHITGFKPHDLCIYQTSLLHKSASHSCHLNNERLEFLGDTILDAIIADYLYKKFRNANEGFLTKQKSNLVKRKHLNEIAHKIGLQQLVSYSLYNKEHKHIFGNALEAFIGAIYIDKGYDKTRKFIEKKIIEPYVDMDQLVLEESDYKSRIIEWGQKHKQQITFDTYEKYSDSKKTPTFASYVLVNTKVVGEGEGKSKKEAEQKASAIGLGKLNEENGKQ